MMRGWRWERCRQRAIITTIINKNNNDDDNVREQLSQTGSSRIKHLHYLKRLYSLHRNRLHLSIKVRFGA